MFRQDVLPHFISTLRDKLADILITSRQVELKEKCRTKPTRIHRRDQRHRSGISSSIKRDPPVLVLDLLADVQDGRILLVLLEELSGCKLLYRFRSSSHRIFRLNNISTALAFLDDRHVKLFGIDASGVADGNPSVVLQLVWTLIQYFQVKEVTGRLQRRLSSSLSSLSMSSYSSSGDLSPWTDDISSLSCNTLPIKGRKSSRETKYHGKWIRTLLRWVQRCTSKFGVEVQDFGRSWRTGLAFLALIKSMKPELVDLRASLSREPRQNLQLAFMIAHHSLDVPPLLEPRDVSGTSPDEKSIITYVSMFLDCCSRTHQDHTTDIEVPEIPNFGSLESVSSGEVLADDPDAEALVRGVKKSSEQLLWTRWSRRSPEKPPGNSLHTRDATSPLNRKESALQPPSPPDAGVSRHEIRSWMDKAAGQDGSKPKLDESHLSLSSEEGIYTLPALDSDEEDAYSYILDLNKEVFQPHNQLKRQVPTVEEETDEEMYLNRQQTEESKHLGVCKKMLNVSKHQEGSQPHRAESEVSAQSVLLRTDITESSPDITESSPDITESSPDRRAVVGCKEENGPKMVEFTCEDDEEDYSDEAMNSVDVDGRTVEEKCQKFKRRLPDRKTTACISAPKRDSTGGVNVHGVTSSASTAMSQSVREEGFILQSPAASVDINPVELQMLVVLWFLLYCCFILHHIIF